MSVSRVPQEGASQALWTQPAADFEQVYGIEPPLEAATRKDNGGNGHTRNCNDEKSFSSVQANGGVEDGENCNVEAVGNCGKEGSDGAKGESNDNGNVESNGICLPSYSSYSNDCNEETFCPTIFNKRRNNVHSGLDESASVSEENGEAAVVYIDRDMCEAAGHLDICMASWLKRSRPNAELRSSSTDAADLRHDLNVLEKQMDGVSLFETVKSVCEVTDQTPLELINCCSNERDKEVSDYEKRQFEYSNNESKGIQAEKLKYFNEKQDGRVIYESDFEKCMNDYNMETSGLEVEKEGKTKISMNECAIKDKSFLKSLCDFEKSLSDYNAEIGLDCINISNEIQNNLIVNIPRNFDRPQEEYTDGMILDGISKKDFDVAKSIIDFEKDLNEYVDENRSDLTDVENMIQCSYNNEELLGKVKGLSDFEKSMNEFTDKKTDCVGHSKGDYFETHGNKALKDGVKSLVDFEKSLNEYAEGKHGSGENLMQCIADKFELKDLQENVCDLTGEDDVQVIYYAENFVENSDQDDATVQTVEKNGQCILHINDIGQGNVKVNRCMIGKQEKEINHNNVYDQLHSVESADVNNVDRNLNDDLTVNDLEAIQIEGPESTVSKKSKQTVSLESGNIPNQLKECRDEGGNKEVDFSFIFEAECDRNKRVCYTRRRNRNRKIHKPQNSDGIAECTDAVERRYPHNSWQIVGSANVNQVDIWNTCGLRRDSCDEATESDSQSSCQNVDSCHFDFEESTSMLNELPSKGARRKVLCAPRHVSQRDSVANGRHDAAVSSAHRAANSRAEFRNEQRSDGNTFAFQEAASDVSQEQCNRHCETCGTVWSRHKSCSCNRYPSRHADDAEEAVSRSVCDNWYRIYHKQLAQIRSYVEYSKEFQNSFRE